MLKQITVFIENKPGRLEEVTGALANGNINLHALSLADTTDFGILRLIVSDPDKAVSVLKANNIMAKTTSVIAVAIGHSPGSLHNILLKLKDLDISIEYMYAFASRLKTSEAIVILSLSNQDAAIEKLQSANFPLLGADLLQQLNEA